jgi:hypothetical protein
MGDAAMALVPKVSFKELVQLLAVAEVEVILADPLINLQSIIQSALPSHPKVRQFSQAQYEIILTGWARLYERVSVSYGLRLKAGVTWPDVALLFNTIVEGVFVRARIDNNEPVLSNGEGILAGAIFVMLPSLVEPLPEDLSTLHAIGGTGCAD